MISIRVLAVGLDFNLSTRTLKRSYDLIQRKDMYNSRTLAQMLNEKSS